jgi:hypothetical protein
MSVKGIEVDILLPQAAKAVLTLLAHHKQMDVNVALEMMM